MHVLTIAGRVLVVICGSIFIYVAVFLYEDEQGKLQSAIEDLWVKISDLQRAMSSPAAFMLQVAHFTESAFNRLFGPKLLSFRSAAVSACYSIASICLTIIYGAYQNDRMVAAMRAAHPNDIILNTRFSDEYGFLFVPSIAAILLFFLVLGTFPAYSNNPRKLKPWFFCVGLAVIAAALSLFKWEHYGWHRFFMNRDTGHTAGHTSILWEHLRFEPTPSLIANRTFIGLMLAAFLVGICIGIISDFLFIAITRRMLRWASEIKSFFRILTIVFVNCLLALILVAGPVVFGFDIASKIFGPHAYRGPFPATILSWVSVAEGLQQAGYVASLSNIVTAFSSLAFVVLAFAALIHKPLWPFLARLAYALQRLGIARHSKLLGSLGLTLLGLGLGFVPNWVKALIEGLGP